MDAWTLDLRSELQAPVNQVGGKALGLGRLAGAGFLVPEGFCITTRAYRELLSSLVLKGASGIWEPDQVRQAILTHPLPPGVLDAIQTSYRRLDPGGQAVVAVRSSATAEDGHSSSSAGLLASYLNVVGPTLLLERVRQCWASLWTPESLLYHHRMSQMGGGGLGHEDGTMTEMAVVVQRLVPAEVAGVLFTRDPVGDRDDRVLVCSAYGLGETVVGGCATDTYVLNKADGRLLRRSLGQKRIMVVPAAGGGTAQVPVPAHQVEAQSLSEDFLGRLAALARKVEETMRGPQDIEWAVAGGELYVLQTRPITSATARVSTSGLQRHPTVWSNANVGEALPGVATPMTWSIIRGFSRKGFECAFGALGLKVPKEFKLVGNIRGRVYLNVTEFVQVASALPFLKASTLLALAGGSCSAEMERLLEPVERRHSLFPFLAMAPYTLAKMGLSHLATAPVAYFNRRSFRQFQDQFYQTDLASTSTAEMLGLLKQVDRVFDRTGEVMLSCGSNCLASVIVVRLVLRAMGEEAAGEEPRLLAGLGVSSAEPGLALMQLAKKVECQPHLKDLLLEAAAHPEGVLAGLGASESGQHFLQTFLDPFLERYGHRAVREAELSTPRWREDPSFLLHVLMRHIQQGPSSRGDSPIADMALERRRATDRVLARMPALMRPIFLALLGHAQRATRRREVHRSHVVEAIGMYRHLFLEIGRRIVQNGYISQVGDVFFLTYPEIQEFLSGELAGDVLASRVVMRRSAYELDKSFPDPPGTFAVGGCMVAASSPCSSDIQAATAKGDMVCPAVDAMLGSGMAGSHHQASKNRLPLLKGLAASPGKVVGKVRKIGALHDISHACTRLKLGEILVAPSVDVGWTPLFLLAGGMVTELGGPLSHTSIVAREYGFPAVVNVDGAMSLLQDGQWVEVDGDAGVVRVLPSPTPTPTSTL